MNLAVSMLPKTVLLQNARGETGKTGGEGGDEVGDEIGG